MAVCMPYSEIFVEDVKMYQSVYNAKNTIIFSTVYPGTTSQIPGAIHIPIEGKHNCRKGFSNYIKAWMESPFVGGMPSKFIQDWLGTFCLLPTIIKDPIQTEILKLLSTTMYGINIAFTQFAYELLGNELIKFWNLEYNNLYTDNLQKYILDAPKGKIGGHCVVPNAELLNKYQENLFSKAIIDCGR